MARTKTPKPTHQEFVFHLRAPSLSYSFGVQHDRHRRERQPFEESEAVQFVTECIWPERLRRREGKAVLYPEPLLADHRLLGPDDVRRKWIGHIKSTKSVFETSLWLPPAVCWRLAEAVTLGLTRSMLTNGPIETVSMTRVTSVSFDGQGFDPIAYVGYSDSTS